MTRINASFPPSQLSDKHLIAEWKELFRMPRFALKHQKQPEDMPSQFCLGTGHMKSMLPYMLQLRFRHSMIGIEMASRGFEPDWNMFDSAWNNWIKNAPHWQIKSIYHENERDRLIVLDRLRERDPVFYANHK